MLDHLNRHELSEIKTTVDHHLRVRNIERHTFLIAFPFSVPLTTIEPSLRLETERRI